jgi:gamma-glutamylcyclotransferase (GGCT)/AIG2-like uncharacterized protein YtfP
MAEGSHRILPLFTYGTLMFPAVVKCLIGRVPEYRPAAIEGYRRLEVAGESYPGLIKEKGNRVEGILYLDLSEEEWKLFTAFEDDFYELEEVMVLSSEAPIRALAYIVPPSRRSVLSERAWDPESFRKTHLPRFSRRAQREFDQKEDA